MLRMAETSSSISYLLHCKRSGTQKLNYCDFVSEGYQLIWNNTHSIDTETQNRYSKNYTHCTSDMRQLQRASEIQLLMQNHALSHLAWICLKIIFSSININNNKRI